MRLAVIIVGGFIGLIGTAPNTGGDGGRDGRTNTGCKGLRWSCARDTGTDKATDECTGVNAASRVDCGHRDSKGGSDVSPETAMTAAFVAAWVGGRERIVVDVGVAVPALCAFRVMDKGIHTEEASNTGVVNAAVHLH